MHRSPLAHRLHVQLAQFAFSVLSLLIVSGLCPVHTLAQEAPAPSAPESASAENMPAVEAPKSNVGKRLDSFSLWDLSGKEWTTESVNEKPFIVV